MLIDIDKWTREYKDKVLGLFNERVVFIGLQGSYGRGEATPDSDIDIVLIVDNFDCADLNMYGDVLDTMQYRDKVCGFVCGKRELLAWEPFDLFQLYNDTAPLYGTLDFVCEKIKDDDIRRAVRIGACNIRHGCTHSMLGGRSMAALRSLYKPAVFTLQALAYIQTGIYEKRRDRLIKLLSYQDAKIIKAYIDISALPDNNEAYTDCDNIACYDKYSELLFSWSGNLIRRMYGDESMGVTLEGERIYLRPWQKEDAEALYKYASDPRVGPAAGWEPHTSVEHSADVIRNVLSEAGTYAVILKNTGMPVGSASIMKGRDCIKEDEVEIGYWIGVPYWGQGLIPEAVNLLLRRSFGELGCSGVWCGHYSDNDKSRRVQEKCGFVPHHSETVKNIYGDMVELKMTYMTKSQYREVQKNERI